MAISYIGGQVGVNTLTIPSHQAGDLIIGFGYRDGNNTAPTLPSGWTIIGSASGGNQNSSVLAYKIANGSAETFGTWTNATSVLCHVYRGAAGVGGQNSAGAQSSIVTYPALTMQVTDGSSWVAAFAGHRSVNTNLQVPPSGMVLRTPVLDATDEAAGFDTDGGVSSWSSTTVSIGGTSSGWRSRVVELLELRQLTMTADLGSFSLSGQNATFTKEYVVSFDGGVYAINGQNVEFANSYSIGLENGNFTSTGFNVGFTTSKTLSVDGGEFNLNGQTATITAQRSLIGGNGQFEIVGQESQINAHRTATADLGQFTLTGENVTITNDGGNAFTLLVDGGTFGLVGRSVTFIRTQPTTGGKKKKPIRNEPVFEPKDYREQILKEDEMMLMFVNELMRQIN